MLAEFYPEQLWLASAGKMGWLGIVPSGALLITIGNLGAAGGYLAATARIPFAVGIDKSAARLWQAPSPATARRSP